MKELPKLIEKLANTKAIIVLLIIGVVAFFVYKNFDFITEITFKIDRGPHKAVEEPDKPSKEKEPLPDSIPDQEEKRPYSPFIAISNLYLTPTAFDIPTSLYFEVSNTGNSPTKNTNILLDLGRAQVVQFDCKPKQYCEVDGEVKGQSLIKIRCSSIPGKETLYVNVLLSAPFFRKIVINSEDLRIPKEIEYEEMIKKGGHQEQKFFSSSFMTFLKIVLGGAILVFAGYFVIATILLLSRYFKIE